MKNFWKTMGYATLNLLFVFAVILSASILISRFLIKKPQVHSTRSESEIFPKCLIIEEEQSKNPVSFGILHTKNGKVVFKQTADGSQATFGKAKSNCVLFYTPNILIKTPENTIFSVPESFFVQILEEVSSVVLKVSYAGKIGYVSKYTVTPVSFVPEVSTLTGIELIVLNVGTQLRIFADSLTNVVCLLSPNDKLEYIASTIGEKPNGESSNIWHFVRFTPESNPTVFFEGYVFSGRTSVLPAIPLNTEADPIDPIDDILTGTENEKIKASSFSKVLMISLIFVMCLPALLFGAYLFFSAHKSRKFSTEI